MKPDKKDVDAKQNQHKNESGSLERRGKQVSLGGFPENRDVLGDPSNFMGDVPISVEIRGAGIAG